MMAAKSECDLVTCKIVHGKQVYDISFPGQTTIAELKADIERQTQIPVAMQKLLYKGILKDLDKKLMDCNIHGQRVILMASKVEDIVKLVAVPAASSTSVNPIGGDSELWMSQTEHIKVLEKGLPDDVETAVTGQQHKIPAGGVRGMMNRVGQKTRLTFKEDVSEVWIGTSDRTQKIRYDQIKNVQSQPITTYPGYSIVALQLGLTEKSKYWLYWVPEQYVESIKETIMGKWTFF